MASCCGPDDGLSYVEITGGWNRTLKKLFIAHYNKELENSYKSYPILINNIKNRISLNLPIACNLDCKFCIQKKDKWYKELIKTKFHQITKFNFKKQHIYAADYRINEIYKLNFIDALKEVFKEEKICNYIYSLFDNTNIISLKNKMVISKINMFVKNIIKINSEYSDIKRYFMITIRPDKIQIPDWLLKLNENINLVLFISFGSLNKYTENNNFETRLKFMENCKENNIKVIPFFKPLVKEWFDFKKSNEIINNILNISETVVIGGLKLIEELVDSLNDNKIIIPNIPLNKDAYIEKDFKIKFIKYIQNLKNIKVFSHRLCAIYDSFNLKKCFNLNTCNL
jgi:hypothetical protein